MCFSKAIWILEFEFDGFINETKTIDMLIIYSYGLMEDMLIKVDDLIFSDDFAVFYMDEDIKVPLISGGPFLLIYGRNVN